MSWFLSITGSACVGHEQDLWQARVVARCPAVLVIRKVGIKLGIVLRAHFLENLAAYRFLHGLQLRLEFLDFQSQLLTHDVELNPGFLKFTLPLLGGLGGGPGRSRREFS